MYLILNKEHFTFHLHYKHSGTFANRKYEELYYPKNQKMCDLILLSLLKMRPHDSQSRLQWWKCDPIWMYPTPTPSRKIQWRQLLKTYHISPCNIRRSKTQKLNRWVEFALNAWRKTCGRCVQHVSFGGFSDLINSLDGQDLRVKSDRLGGIKQNIKIEK